MKILNLLITQQIIGNTLSHMINSDYMSARNVKWSKKCVMIQTHTDKATASQCKRSTMKWRLIHLQIHTINAYIHSVIHTYTQKIYIVKIDKPR